MPKVNFEASAHGKNLWVAVGEDMGRNNAAIYTSPTPDFNNATERTSASNSIINCIVSGKDKFVCGHKNGQFSYSLNGINWQVSNAHEAVIGNFGITTIKYENNKFVAIGGTNIFHSDDGITWNVIDIGKAAGGLLEGTAHTPGNFQGSLTYNSPENKWFAISSKIIFESGDGEIWNFDDQYHDGGASAKFPDNTMFKDLDCNPNNGIMVAAATDGYAVYDPAQQEATKWSWFAANADGLPDLESVAGPHHFEGVIYANDKFYIGGKDKMGTDDNGQDADDKAIFWESNNDGANWTKVDTGNLLADGQIITGFSYSDNSLVITCDKNILHLPFQGGREILLGGNISVENNLSTKGCHISIEGVSEHGNKDTEMKLVLHGDLEVSNKKISIESNDDANKLEVKGNSKIDQDLTSDSTQPVKFHHVEITKGLDTAVTVATMDDIDYKDEYNTILGNEAADPDAPTVTEKIDALLKALNITVAAGGASGSGSDGQIVNGIIKIKKAFGGQYLNVNTPDPDPFNKADTDVESELALTDINGNFSLSAEVTAVLNTDAVNGGFFIEIKPITAAALKARNTYVGQVVTRPTYDKQSDENVDMTFSNVLPETDYTSKNIAITPLTTIKSKMVSDAAAANAGESNTAVTNANNAVKDTFNIDGEELNEVDPYSVLEEPDDDERDKAKKVLDRISEVMTITDSIVASTKNASIAAANKGKSRDDVFAKIATTYTGNNLSIMGNGGNASKIKDEKVTEIVNTVVTGANAGDDRTNTKKVVDSYLVQARVKREEDMDTTSATDALQKTNNTVEKFKQRIAKESKFVRALKEVKERVPDFADFNDNPDAINTEFIKDEIESKEELTFTKSTPIAWEANDKDTHTSEVGVLVDGKEEDNFTATYKVITDGNATISLNSNPSNLTLKTKYKKNQITITVTNIPIGQHVLELKAKIPEASEDLAIFKKINITRDPPNDGPVTLPAPEFTTQATQVEQAEDDADETEILDVGIDPDNDEIQIEDIEDPDKEKVTNVSREFKIKTLNDKAATNPDDIVKGLFVRPRKFGLYKIGLIVRRKSPNTNLLVRKIIFLLVKPRYKIKTLKFDVTKRVQINLFWNRSIISIDTGNTYKGKTKTALEIVKQIRKSAIYSRLPFTVSFDRFDGNDAIIKMKGKVAKNGFNFFYTDWVYDFTPFTIKLADIAINALYTQDNGGIDIIKLVESDVSATVAMLKLPGGYNDEDDKNIRWTIVSGDGVTLDDPDDDTNNKLLKVSKDGDIKIKVEYIGSGGNAPDITENIIDITVVPPALGNQATVVVNTVSGKVFGYSITEHEFNVFSGKFNNPLDGNLGNIVPSQNPGYNLIQGHADSNGTFIAYNEGGGNIGGKKNYVELFTIAAGDRNNQITEITLFSASNKNPSGNAIEITPEIRYSTFDLA